MRGKISNAIVMGMCQTGPLNGGFYVARLQIAAAAGEVQVFTEIRGRTMFLVGVRAYGGVICSLSVWWRDKKYIIG